MKSVKTLALLLPLTLIAWPLTTKASAPAETVQDSNEKLVGYMREIYSSLRGLSKSMKGDMKGAIDDVCKLQRTVMNAKDQVPVTLAAMEGDERSKGNYEYRVLMHELLRGLFDVEAALAAGDAEKATQALRAVNKLKNKGHGKFKN